LVRGEVALGLLELAPRVRKDRLVLGKVVLEPVDLVFLQTQLALVEIGLQATAVVAAGGEQRERAD
jgi:hypothetical protein